FGKEPRAEAAEVAICDARSVFELEHRALVRRRVVAKAAGHAQMHEEDVTALEADEDVLAAALDCGNAIAFDARGDDLRVIRPRQSRVVDARRRDPLALDASGEPSALGLDLG